MRANIRSCATGIFRQKRHQQTLPAEEEQGLRALKSDHSIVVVPADKGGATVIMDKTDYVNKANIIFSDTDSYTILTEGPTKKQTAAIKKKVNELARLKVIGPDDSKFMTLRDSHVAHAYGLPKVHKIGAPLRIIVTLIGSPTYNLAKWLYKHLKPLTHGSRYSINSSHEFINRIDGLNRCEKALRELKADKDLVIVPADKGRSTVVLDRTDYLQKAKGLLEDRQFYVPCATNPVKALTREINATLLALENSGAITPTDRRMARPQDTALARFYGLPKVHKDGAPLRPIVSLKGTPTYGLTKWLFRRLKFLTAESDTTVSSSAEFLEKPKGDLAIETIELLLQSKYDETENRLGRAQVLQLLKFCLRTYFTFDGTIYEQVKGTPMGSPISGFIAGAVLQRLESLVFQHHKPTFWARYVDDTFVVIDRDQLMTFKERLNAVFPDIHFTMEEEENNQLAFLNVLVCRKDCGGLKTRVFRKVTNTKQVLNFNSNHPISHKGSCVRTLYRPVEMHCSEPEDKIAEIQYLGRVFKANGYPSNFVNRCIRKMDERPNRRDTKVWRALPYVKNVSEAVGRLLAPLGVGVAHRPEATIRRQLMKPKDPLLRQETSGVVYRIWCSCGQSNYVGETGRQLRTRMAEHAAAVRRNDASSQVAAHSTGSGHTFKFDEAEILARGDNRVSRELLESWFTGPRSINKCNNLPIQYSVLRLRLGGEIGHARSALMNTLPNTRVSASDGRAIITPTSNARDEIAAINDANIGHHATCNDP
nr:unnamed protein product [Spirometra erinaceieuropaei]